VPSVWGYARVSREDQQLALQLDALEAAGVPHANIVKEKESGARQRAGFEALLERLQPGDSLVAWKVDRLGRDALAALVVARDLDRRGVRVVITTSAWTARRRPGAWCSASWPSSPSSNAPP